jgi:photosystem II cytochrome c550
MQKPVWIGQQQNFWSLLFCAVAIWIFSGTIAPELALAAPDPYVAQYLKVLPGQQADLMDQPSNTKAFSYGDLLIGKELFGQTCLSCHVGGSTVASPDLSLSLVNLQAMNPPRDTIASLMDYMRHPTNAGEESDSCREVQEKWITDQDLEKIAAFTLRAATTAPGWGTAQF